MTILILAALINFVVPSSQAQTTSSSGPEFCPNASTTIGNVNVNFRYDALLDSCRLMLSRDVQTGVDAQGYPITRGRIYTFDSSGGLLVQDTFAPGRRSQSESFFLYPRQTEHPQFRVDSNGELVVTTTSGHEFRFSQEGELNEQVSGFRISENLSPSTNPRPTESDAALSFIGYPGVLIRSGRAFTSTAYEQSSRSSEVLDHYGAICTVPNSELFAYFSGRAAFNPRFNSSLNAVLSSRCSSLNLSSLTSVRPSGLPRRSAPQFGNAEVFQESAPAVRAAESAR